MTGLHGVKALRSISYRLCIGISHLGSSNTAEYSFIRGLQLSCHQYFVYQLHVDDRGDADITSVDLGEGNTKEDKGILVLF